MSLANQLAGALGLASWRAHFLLTEYAGAAPSGMIFAGAKSAQVQTPQALGLNEVGVTDSVIATMWRCAPASTAASTTGPAEKHHFGADLAIVDLNRNRLLLYQAKLGSLTPSGDLVLKSQVPSGQVKLLRRRSVLVGGRSFSVTGRLAIYQIDYTPHLHLPPGFSLPHSFLIPFGVGPADALQYFQHVLSPHSISPGGVLAAAIPVGKPPVKSVKAASTWPWEFDAYHWAHNMPSYFDLPGEHANQEVGIGPEWRNEKYEDIRQSRGVAVEFADQLHRALGLPRRHQLHVLVVDEASAE